MKNCEKQFNIEKEIETDESEKEKNFFQKEAEKIMEELKDVPDYGETIGLGKNWRETSEEEIKLKKELEQEAKENKYDSWKNYCEKLGWKEDIRKNTLNLIKECECLCRHALAIKADNIVLMDKSARGYGYIFHKILPLMRMEQAKLENIPLYNIASPKIRYINPPEEFSKLSEKSLKVLEKIFSNKTSVIFDESSRDADINDYNPNLTPNEQYTYYDTNKITQQNKEWLRNRQFEKESEYACFAAQRILKFIKSKFPNSSPETHIGLNRALGGNLRGIAEVLKKQKILKYPEKTSNISSLMIHDKSYDNDIIAEKNLNMTKEKWADFRRLQNILVKVIIDDVCEKSFKNDK